MNRKQYLTGSCAAVFLAWLLLGMAPAFGAKSQPAQMTLLIYMTGSNLETEAGIATENLRDMARYLPEDGSLQVIVMASGSEEWHCEVDADAANIYALTSQGLALLKEGPHTSMGASGTLLELLEYGASCASDRCALLLWDHGAGPMAGVCFDERYTGPDGMDGLTMAELYTALEASLFAEKKLEWIGFDACFMSSIETAGVVAPFAEYMIASQEPEPAEGWDYQFLATVAADASPVATAERIVGSYAAAYGEKLTDVTLSCIDLSHVQELISGLSEAFEEITVTAERYPALAKARSSAQTIGNSKPYPYDLVDLQSLLAAYQDAGLLSGGDLQERLAETVVCNYSNHENRNGLSIYYPLRNKERYISPWAENYRSLNAPEGYQDFLEAFGTIWLGEALANWNSPHVPEAEDADANKLFLELEKEQAGQLQSARLMVVSEKAPDEYTFVYESEDVDISSQGVLSCKYRNDALYFVGGDGVLQTGAIDYTAQEDGIFLPVLLYNRSGDGQPLVPEQKEYFLYYRENPQGALELADIMEKDDTGIRYNRSALKLEDWEIIQFSSVGRIPSADGDGRRRPYDEWDAGGYLTGYELNVEELGTPQFFQLQDSSKRYAFFEMTDLQGNTVSSELFPLDNPNRREILIDTVSWMDNEVCKLSPVTAEAVSGDDPGLEITFQAENRSGQNLNLRFTDYRFDQLACEDTFFGGGCYLDAGKTKRFRLHLGAEAILKTGLDYINELSCTVNCSNEDYNVIASEEAKLSLQVSLSFLSSGTQ